MSFTAVIVLNAVLDLAVLIALAIVMRIPFRLDGPSSPEVEPLPAPPVDLGVREVAKTNGRAARVALEELTR